MENTVFMVISNLAGGGAQRVVSTLSQGLYQHYRLYLILHDGKRIDYPYSGEVVDLKTPVAKSYFRKATIFVLRILRLKALKRKLRPCAAISLMESSNYINLFSGRKGKTIISVRNYKSQQGRSLVGRFFQFLIRSFYNRGDWIIVPSEGIKADLVDNFKITGNRAVVIYNPFDLELIEKKAAELLDEKTEAFYDGPVLITAGSMLRQKGQGHLIRALKEIKNQVPGAKLVILGEGNLRSYLEQLAADLELKDWVLLPGFESNPFKFISRSSVFVMPSLFEGFPNALVEAMACGVPVIASDCPAGPREILAPDSEVLSQTKEVEWAEHGILVPVCSGELYTAKQQLRAEEKMLADAVIKLLSDKSLYAKYKNKSLKRAKDFEVSRIIKQWVELIES